MKLCRHVRVLVMLLALSWASAAFAEAPAAPAPAGPFAPAAAVAAPAPAVAAPVKPVAPPVPPLADSKTQPVVPRVGNGFHLFDKHYVLLGFNALAPCSSTAVELEASAVPWILHGMWWFGAYATGGFQNLRPSPQHLAPSEESPCFSDDSKFHYALADSTTVPPPAQRTRYGAGIEAGWRMIGLDVGMLHNGILQASTDGGGQAEANGLRFRLGLALADEVFTGSDATYRRDCCKEKCSVVDCECKRTPVGVSIFLYYGNELYFREGHFLSHKKENSWDDGMVGVSVKIGVGL